MSQWHIWERCGVELEYMIVDRESWDVRPLASPFLQSLAGSSIPHNEVECGDFSWSNELVSHVVELKTTLPFADWGEISASIHREVHRANEILAPWGALLLPGGTHPWMDPHRETVLWAHAHSEIYAQYHKVFGCREHGWSNLQSTHLNLSFQGDAEFSRLHAAVRAVLPLIPAVAAASPFMDSAYTGFLDGRLETYRHNQASIPEIAGEIIPEAVYSQAEYEGRIFVPMRSAMAERDSEGILQPHFLNSRGAIARFDRGSLEIRLVDNQECPRADLALLEGIVALLQHLDQSCEASLLRALATPSLAAGLLDAIGEGEHAVLADSQWRQCLGSSDRACTMGEIWRELLPVLLPRMSEQAGKDFTTLVQRGPLARRMLQRVGLTPTRAQLRTLCAELAACLANNQFFS